MSRRLTTLLLTAASAVAPLGLGLAHSAHAQSPGTQSPSNQSPTSPPVSYPMPTSPSVTRASGDVVLSIGRGQLINLPGTMKDVFVADDKIADVQVKSNHQLYIFGKGPGQTTIYASNATGQVIWSTNVRVGSNIDNVDQMLKVAMPEAKIAVATMGTSTVLLTGTVAAPEDAAEAQRLVQAYMGKDANVIARLKTATPLQVMLQVRISEVSRSLARSIGNNFVTSNNKGGFQYAIGQGRSIISSAQVANPALGVGVNPSYYGIDPTTISATNPAGTLAKFPATGIAALSTATTIAAQTHFLGLDLVAALDLGEQAGLVTTLAQPNLTALSGETAEFLAGGEFPIPISSGINGVGIEFKKFGVSLAYTPTVLADGRISLRVRPEVSELSSEGAITISGFNVPALSVRRAETTVELGSGQSFMIGGLLSNKANHTIQKMPGAGDVPILGALFRSTSFQKNESELVIVVTPYLVRPVNDGDIKLPTDGFENPNTIQQVLGNMSSDGKSDSGRPHPTKATQAAVSAKIGAADKPSISADLPGLLPGQPRPQSQSGPATAMSEGPARSRDDRTADAGTTKTPGFSLN